MSVRNPDSKLSVWPLSLSLAATEEIDLSFSSYGYLDVSVPRVPPVSYTHLDVYKRQIKSSPLGLSK